MTAPASTSLVSIDDIRAAAARIAGVARRTPLIDVGGIDGEPAFAIKCENMQPAGAFKIRGAYNMLAQLAADARAAGVITYSSGNHGTGDGARRAPAWHPRSRRDARDGAAREGRAAPSALAPKCSLPEPPCSIARRAPNPRQRPTG